MGVITFKLEGDEARAVSAFLKVVDAQKKTEEGARRMGRGHSEMSQAMAAGAQVAMTAVTALAGGYMGVAGAINLAKQALRDLEAERKKAAQRTTEEAALKGELAQLGFKDPAAMKRLLAEAAKSRTQVGMTADQAHALQFTLRSMGEESNREFFAGFHGITEPGALAEGASTLKAAFGAQATGGTRALVNKLFAASEVSKARIQQFAPAATIAAQTTREIGGTDVELLGTMAILSRATRDVDVAGTQLAALSKTLIQQGLGGQGILKGVDAIQKVIEGVSPKKAIRLFAESDEDRKALAGLDDVSISKVLKGAMKPEDIPAFFGRLEGFKAFRAIQLNRADIDKTVADVAAAATVGPGDVSDRVKAAWRQIPDLPEMRERQIAEQRLQIKQEEMFAGEELRRQRIIDDADRQAMERGEWSMQRWGRRKSLETMSWLGFSAETLNATNLGLNATLPNDWGELAISQNPLNDYRRQTQGRTRGTGAAAKQPATQPSVVINGDVYGYEVNDLSKRPASRPAVEVD